MDHFHNDDDLPKDAIEISEDVDEYNNLNSNILSNENIKISQEDEFKKKNYVELLETKIREQATRLIELQTYKSLCENKIRQIIPNHPLPIIDKHLKKGSNDYLKTDSNIDSLKHQVYELKNLLSSKENELSQLQKKYETVASKNRQLISEGSKNNQIKENNARVEFPRVEKIQNENLRENYNKLWINCKEIYREKDQILESLKKETLLNEEQRNYIEILKQTIETSINKFGMNQLISNQKTNFPRNLSNVEIMAEFTKNTIENDSSKKENSALLVKINELKSEIDFLTQTNTETQTKKDKIRETLETGIRELEHAKDRVKKLEEDKEYLIEDFENLKSEYEKAINDYNLLLTEYDKLKNDNQELAIKKEENEKFLINQTSLEKNLLEHKKNYEKLNEDYKIALKDKTNIKIENDLNLEDLNKKNEEIGIFKLKIDELEKKTTEQTHKFNNEIEREKKNNENYKQEKDDIIRNSNEKLKNVEKNYFTYKQLYEEVINEFSSYKEKIEKTSVEKQNNSQSKSLHDDKIELFKKENEKLKEKIENLEKNSKIEENSEKIKELTNSYENQLKIKSTIEKEYDQLKDYTSLINQEFEALKENYYYQINLKEDEIQRLNSDLNEYINEINKYKKQLSEYTNELEYLQSENSKLQRDNNQDYQLILDESNKKERELIKVYDECNKELEYYKNLSEEMKEDIRNLRDELKVKSLYLEEESNIYKYQIDKMSMKLEESYQKQERLAKELEETIVINNDLEARLVNYRRNNEDLLTRMEVLENENFRIEKNRRKLFEENESFRRNDKQLTTIQMKTNFHDIKTAIQSCLNVARSFMNKIVSNKEFNDFSKIFTDKLPQYYQISSIPTNENSAVESLKSLEDWICVICTELESCFHNIQELSFNRNSNSKILIQSQSKDEIDIKKMNIQMMKLQEDNRTLFYENESLKNQLDQINSKDNNVTNHEIMNDDKWKYSEELENLRKEITTLKELNQKLIHENMSKNKKNYKQSDGNTNLLENVIFQLAKIFPSNNISKIIHDIVILNDKYSQIEREKIVLEKKLSVLEFDSQRNEKYKESLKDNNDLETENIGAINFEIENLRKLILDYDNKLLDKKNLLRKMQNDLKNIGNNTRYCLENVYEIETKNKQLQKELDEIKDEMKRSKNSASSNVFKSNYIDKPQDQKRNIMNIEVENHKFERPKREMINNSFNLKNIETNISQKNDISNEFKPKDLSFSRNKNIKDSNSKQVISSLKSCTISNKEA